MPSNDTMATRETSIAKDVSLATTRVDTDEDQYQGLDLSVGTRRITSQLFDTKSLELGTFEQPLDLTCTKQLEAKEDLRADSPPCTQMDMNGSGSEFNYVYVYPGLYPPGSVVNATDDLDAHPEMTSPVPELVSPGKIPSPDTLSRAQYLATTEALETAFGNANFNRNTKQQVSPQFSIGSNISPQSQNKRDKDVEIRPKPYSPASQGSYAQRAPPSRGGKGRDSKKSKEMKVISEHTSAGVYTSVMKLPWSRRTRTKKPRQKEKLEDTLIPQFMLEQQPYHDEHEGEMPSPGSTSGGAAMHPQHSPSPCSTPATSQSVMMVYPNNGSGSYGKPVRKRGRPPKLPMLAKLLHEQQGVKREKMDKEEAEMQAHINQQVQANGGMVVYNSGGQIMSAYGSGVTPQADKASSVSPRPASSTPKQEGGAQAPTPTMPPLIPAMGMPDMSQAQFLGQVPLSQITGGPIQFLGQFPANALPFPGHALQGFPMSVQNTDKQDQGSLVATDGQKFEFPPLPPGFQFAFPPMFIPHSVSFPLPSPQAPLPVTITAGEVKTETTNSDDAVKSSVSQSADMQNHVVMSSGSTQVMHMPDSSSVSTMSTTSISNTESGAIYQEMILSSKSLVDVKRRKRQTAIQMLKAKSGDNNFLCTSFRIRPRLVAQAQAQRERQAGCDVKKEEEEADEIIAGQKNLLCPQSDTSDHFGETNNVFNVNLDEIVIKREVDEDDFYSEMDETSEKETIDATCAMECKEVKPSVVPKHLLALKGSQKRKAKFYGSRIVNEHGEKSTKVENGVGGESQATNEGENDMFQEMFNCKICNKIISVDDMESHSLDHLKSTVYQCGKCGKGQGERGSVDGSVPACDTCNEPLVLVDCVQNSGDISNIECDECSETFKSLPEFYEHKTAHRSNISTEGEFECDFCGKVYQYYHALQFHRRTHRERRVPCLEKSCEMKFRSRKEMENHFDVKHPDRKEYFHCVYDGCTKRFLKNFHLQEHIRVKHYNIKAFQCPWPGCTKEFAAQRHLKIHLLIHRDEKPMKCDHCEYRCRQRSAMNWHMRKHPDVPYKYKRAVKSPSNSKSDSD